MVMYFLYALLRWLRFLIPKMYLQAATSVDLHRCYGCDSHCFGPVSLSLVRNRHYSIEAAEL